MDEGFRRSDASILFEAKWREGCPGGNLPTSGAVERIDFGPLAPYLLKGIFTRPTGARGAGARMDVDHAGEGIASRLNVDITGFEYFCRLLPDEKALIVNVFEALFDHSCGRWRVMFYRFDKGMKLAVDTTFFPYLCEETGCERVGALIVPAEAPEQPAPKRKKGRAYAAEAGPAAQWIDLGAGVPDRTMLTLLSAIKGRF